MKLLLLSWFFFIAANCPAQSTDFMLLKNKSRTVKTYFPGSSISFTSANGAHIEGDIYAIKNDTLFLKQYIIRQVTTQLGFYILDTSTYYVQYHYNQIKSMGTTGRHFDLGGSGAVLMGGGLLLTIASGVVYLADNKKFSPQLLAASAGLIGVGYLLSKKAGKGMVIGKKFSLLYVKAVDNKKG